MTVISLIQKQERSSVETHSILSSQNIHELLKAPYEWWQDIWPDFDPIVQELTQSLLETSHCQAASIEFIATQVVLWGNLIHLLEQGQNYLGFFHDCYWFNNILPCEIWGSYSGVVRGFKSSETWCCVVEQHLMAMWSRKNTGNYLASDSVTSQEIALFNILPGYVTVVSNRSMVVNYKVG